MKHVTIITGPTCSGKSGYALDIAEGLDGVIINADAMQVYADLPVLTAQPTRDEQARVPHRLYGVLDGAEACTAARWTALAVQDIRRTWAQGRHPMLVGGTGLYLRTLMHGIANIPDIPDTVRSDLRQRMSHDGPHAFHAWLSGFDPVMAARLKPGDTQRLLRAGEVKITTGRSLADWQADPLVPPLPEAAFHLTAIRRDRTALYARIDARFAQMMESGALEEVARLRERALSPDLPIMRAHGVPELLAHLSGEMSREAAIAQARQNTRNYAKRQGTWIKHQFPQAERVTLE